MLRKITAWESLGISQKNYYSEVSFSKVTSLQFSECNFTIKRFHYRFFLDHVPKTSLERIFWDKTLWWPSALLKLQPWVHNPQFYQKSGAHVRPSCRSGESYNIFTGKPPWWSPVLAKVASLGFFPAISLKRLHHRVLSTWVLHGSSF